MRVLVVDNHDSFVHTLVGYLRELGAAVDLVEADTEDATGLARMLHRYDGVLLSPGPGRPGEAGVDIVALCASRRMPLLGVCLGHQVIGAAFGTEVSEAPELMHGMVSAISHNESGLFDGIPSPVDVGRYHSLALAEADLPAVLEVTARTASGTVMAIAHRDLPIAGVQFHPESVLTEHGYRLLANWLTALGSRDALDAAAALHPMRQESSPVRSTAGASATDPTVTTHLAHAIALASANVRNAGGPFGAVLVAANGRVFEGVNRVTAELDPSAHAEVSAIRNACAALGTFDLAGAVLYTSCEPCPMCLATSLWARIDRIFFAASRNDAAEAGFDDALFYRYFEGDAGDRAIMPVVQERVTAVQRIEPFTEWKTLSSRTEY